jgi:NAD(P)-dependent dehydrogenase (short-subunit alcohol dehydrogenase family)
MTTPTSVPMPIPNDLVAAESCLKGRVILVTGATGSLGRVAALAFAAAGATVILHGRSQKKLDTIYDEIESNGWQQPAIVTLDYLKANEADFKGMADTIHATFKRLDGIFHGAGHVAPLTPLASQDFASWQAHTTINLNAPIAITRACMPMLKRAVTGVVVFLSETHTIVPKAYWGAFAVSKGAIHHVAQIWNDELERENSPRMKVLIPGPVVSQCRSITHPGELASALPTTAALEHSFLLLMSADARLPSATVYGEM